VTQAHEMFAALTAEQSCDRAKAKATVNDNTCDQRGTSARIHLQQKSHFVVVSSSLVQILCLLTSEMLEVSVKNKELSQ
jgi:hypothetical protein